MFKLRSKLKKVCFLFLIISVSLIACKSDNKKKVISEGTVAPPWVKQMASNQEASMTDLKISTNVRVFSTKSQSKMFTQTYDFSWSDEENKDTLCIDIYPEERFQTIDGFGASFTDSSAYLMNQILSPDDRKSLMTALFDTTEGIGLKFLRNPMGSSDYARFFYSYNDLAKGDTDFDLKKFSIAHDEQDIIPLLKEALAINPNIKIMGSPWSAPGWMKTTGEMIGGELREDCYEVFADYFIRYIQDYAKQGISIYAISPQNEPLYVPPHYAGMGMSAEAQSTFIAQHLGPALEKTNANVKLFCYDHNWDGYAYAQNILASEAGKYIDGVAWHWYGGKPSAQTTVYKQFPKEVHVTEASGGEWIPPFDNAFSAVMTNGIDILRNYGKSFVLWNMALDENNGPVVPGFGRSTCRGIVKINQKTKKLEYNLDYFALAHFSKFTQDDAVRIHSIERGGVKSIAMQNPDNSINLVLLNTNKTAPKEVQVRIGKTNKLLNITMQAKEALTIVFEAMD